MSQLKATAINVPFITTWKTDNPGFLADNQINIPGTSTNYDISWVEVGNPGNTGMLTGNGNTIVTFPTRSAFRDICCDRQYKEHSNKYKVGEGLKVMVSVNSNLVSIYSINNFNSQSLFQFFNPFSWHRSTLVAPASR